ncbi:hypothetical protein BRARA_C00837 [Brassica rapa]|uniref:Uncharacterized protein n=1 Tax=Brassica campestris TaxID=3711 RepID=A0A397ZW83_BRACM|nr:hypothetical protein BRARA_C00837 [Brassica rapa]
MFSRSYRGVFPIHLFTRYSKSESRLPPLLCPLPCLRLRSILPVFSFGSETPKTRLRSLASPPLLCSASISLP